jgi:hypothetical protein
MIQNALLTESLIVTQYDFDPDVTTAVDVAWVDMRDCDKILMGFFRTIGTSDATMVALGNSASNGGGTDVTLKTKTLTGVQPNAVGDTTWLEVSADEIVALSEGGSRYVSLNMSLATGTDEGVVTYIRVPKTKKSSNTADVIA